MFICWIVMKSSAKHMLRLFRLLFKTLKMTEVAINVIPAKQKTKFPPEFTEDTISIIHQKRRLWRHMQKSGVQVTRSLRDKYRTLCNNTKQAIKYNTVNFIHVKIGHVDLIWPLLIQIITYLDVSVNYKASIIISMNLTNVCCVSRNYQTSI